MRSDIGIEVTGRFFDALYELKRIHVLRGKGTFTRRYGISRWNLNMMEKGKGTQVCVNLQLLVYLVRDYAVSAHWLLTGEGTMFTDAFDASLVKGRQTAFFKKAKTALNLNQQKAIS